MTIDEVPELKKKLSKLNQLLLNEVAFFAGIEIGDALLFDLGGNAAEYKSDGKTYSYSAFSFVDDRGEVQSSPQ